ncbi:MAG: hypothetical protein N2Z84_03905 [Atribacterota bacterium]|nr:hypothetical protein [Atribacterota bacterium]
MRMITTMAVLVIFAPFIYLFLLKNNPHSFWVRNFIWIFIIVIISVFLGSLSQKKGR